MARLQKKIILTLNPQSGLNQICSGVLKRTSINYNAYLAH
jgi:hypothetical protein